MSEGDHERLTPLATFVSRIKGFGWFVGSQGCARHGPGQPPYAARVSPPAPAEEPPERPAHRSGNPPPLTVAASLAAVQGALLVLLALLEVGNLSSQRMTMGVTTSAFFLLYGAALIG